MAGECGSVSRFKGRHILLPFMRFIYHTTVRSVAFPLPLICPLHNFPLVKIAENRATVLHAAAQSKRLFVLPASLLQHMSSNQLATLPQTRLRDL